jgi:hypothetical protein
MRLDVEESWTVSPLRIARIPSACGSETSDAGTSGPTGQNVSATCPASTGRRRTGGRGRDVVRDDVAGDRLERVLLRDAADGAADDDAELGLVVALRDERGDHDRVAGPIRRS